MNTAIILILAVVCFFIGIIAAYLFQSLREESKSDQADYTLPGEEDAGAETLEASQQVPQAAAYQEEQVIEREQGHSPPLGLIEVAHLWRDKATQKPTLEMDGALFHEAEEMSLSQLEKLEAVVKDLSTWIKKPILVENQPVEAGAFLALDTGERHPYKPPKMGPLDIIKNTLDADVRAALKSAPKSLAAQVDEILQVKLAGTHMVDRGIRIMDTPSADLVVMVGLQKYDGVDAVPDTEIQTLIREAVAEWGRRATLEGGKTD